MNTQYSSQMLTGGGHLFLDENTEFIKQILEAGFEFAQLSNLKHNNDVVEPQSFKLQP